MLLHVSYALIIPATCCDTKYQVENSCKAPHLVAAV